MGYTRRSSLVCAPVGHVPLPIRKTLEAARGARVHVRLTESLTVSCSRHLELSGSRVKPTAAPRGVTFSIPWIQSADSSVIRSGPSLMIASESLSRAELRRLLRRRRRSLSRLEQRQAARALYRRLAQHALFRRARHIAMYLPNDGEIDPRLLLEEARRRGKATYLPVLNPWPRTRMAFQRVRAGERLRSNRFGIAEPARLPKRQRKPWALDLILLPLVGFDEYGGRLGMGGGFYDRSLAFLQRRKGIHKPRLIGLAHDCQKVDRLAQASWDVPLQACVTGSGWYGTSG